MRYQKHLLTAALLSLSTAVVAQDAPLRNLTVEQEATAQIEAPRAVSLKALIAADRADATYAVGETVHLTLTANEDAFVTVVDIGPTGEVTQLFPNKYQTDNHVVANRPVEIASSGAKVVVNEPTGTELIKVVASSKPIAVIPESELQAAGAFRSVEGGVGTVMRDLQVVADAPPAPEAEIAFSNYALYTISSRTPAASQALVIVPGQSAATPTPAPAPAAPPPAPASTPAPSATPGASLSAAPAAQPIPPQPFNTESFKLDASAITNWSVTTISYSITNNSGTVLYLGIMSGSVALGACTEVDHVTGQLQLLPSPHATAYNADPQRPPLGAFIPVGGRATGAIVMGHCSAPNPGFETAPLSIALMVGKSESFKTMTTFPLSGNAALRKSE